MRAGACDDPPFEIQVAAGVEGRPGLGLNVAEEAVGRLQRLAVVRSQRVHGCRLRAPDGHLEHRCGAATDEAPGAVRHRPLVQQIAVEDRVARLRAQVDRASGIGRQVVQLGNSAALIAIEDGREVDAVVDRDQRTATDDVDGGWRGWRRRVGRGRRRRSGRGGGRRGGGRCRCRRGRGCRRWRGRRGIADAESAGGELAAGGGAARDVFQEDQAQGAAGGVVVVEVVGAGHQQAGAQLHARAGGAPALDLECRPVADGDPGRKAELAAELAAGGVHHVGPGGRVVAAAECELAGLAVAGRQAAGAQAEAGVAVVAGLSTQAGHGQVGRKPAPEPTAVGAVGGQADRALGALRDVAARAHVAHQQAQVAVGDAEVRTLPGAEPHAQALAGSAAGLTEAHPGLGAVAGPGVGAAPQAGVARTAAVDPVPAGRGGDVDGFAPEVGQVDRAGTGLQLALNGDPATGVEGGPGFVLESGHGSAAVLVHEAAHPVDHDRAGAAAHDLQEVGVAASDVGPAGAVVDVGLEDRIARRGPHVDALPGVGLQVVEPRQATLLGAVEHRAEAGAIRDLQRTVRQRRDGHGGRRRGPGQQSPADRSQAHDDERDRDQGQGRAEPGGPPSADRHRLGT